jgi:hypothetical protein
MFPSLSKRRPKLSHSAVRQPIERILMLRYVREYPACVVGFIEQVSQRFKSRRRFVIFRNNFLYLFIRPNECDP